MIRQEKLLNMVEHGNIDIVVAEILDSMDNFLRFIIVKAIKILKRLV
jgi:hypothetical protein